MINGFTGKKTTHSKPASVFGTGSVRMPPAQPKPKFNVPKDHNCKVCPGANRGR